MNSHATPTNTSTPILATLEKIAHIPLPGISAGEWSDFVNAILAIAKPAAPPPSIGFIEQAAAAQDAWLLFNETVRGKTDDYGPFTNAHWQAANAMRAELTRLCTPPLTSGEKPVDYSVPTPRTEAFMARIDDTSIDLSQVEAHSHDLECELIAATSRLSSPPAPKPQKTYTMDESIAALRKHVHSGKIFGQDDGKIAGATPLPSIGDGKDGERKPVLDWMHNEVVRQMDEHPAGTCQVCDARRAAMSAQSPQSGREEGS